MAAKKPSAKGSQRPKKPARRPAREAPPQREAPAPPPSESAVVGPASHGNEGTGNAGKSRPPIVGLVASAGGLEAFTSFFSAMPPDNGIAFVLVPHLDPTHESLMVELIARHTRMTVVEVTEGTRAKANHVYVIPPNRYMSISAGTLHLTGPIERGDRQTPIDLFLCSLADDQHERSICVILSGTGAHGTLGLKAIKSAGGMAMVQDPLSTQYSRMPQSAIDTGLADFILPPDKMPEVLLKYLQHPYVNGENVASRSIDAEHQLNEIVALLHARAKIDFRYYRKKMLARRITRRMGLSHFYDLGEYLAFLRDHPEEVQRLTRDCLVSVTSFFRDPEAFGVLESKAIAPLIAGLKSGDALRVWVPCCATGEEAYSIAMVFLEQMSAHQKNCQLQVFATDVDLPALETARQGIYPESVAAGVSPERLARFFTPVEGSKYQIDKSLREILVFAAQNVITDPPFSNIDLVSCRNFLIYVEPEMQSRIIGLLHFALRPDGYLFLGSAESIGRHTDLFEPISRKWRLYRRIGMARLARPEFPVRLGARTPYELGHGEDTGKALTTPLTDLAQRILLNELAPTAVLVNRKLEALYFVGQTGRYLELPTGEPSLDITEMAPQGMRSKLRGAIYRAIHDRRPVELPKLTISRNGERRAVAVKVTPIESPKAAEGLLLILFRDVVPGRTAAPPEAGKDDSLAAQLESELQAAKEELQGTIEEMESSNEELKASNEEVMSMNEELQSANEELQTTKEELQSLNEELNTVNNQLRERVEELETANNDIANLLNCSDVPTVFLDTKFCIRRFTPAATRLFSLISSDVERPLSHIRTRFTDPDLLTDVESVLTALVPQEKEVHSDDGRSWVRRIMPYRTLDNRIAGIVVTFGDVTQIRAADVQALRERESRLAAILNTAADAIITIDQHGIIEAVNDAAERMFGYTATELVGKNVKALMPPPFAERHDGYLANYLKTGVAKIIGIGRDVMAVRKDGSQFPAHLAVSEVKNAKLFTGILHDISHRKQLEREIVEIAMLEQKRLGADLHDECGQQLTALGLLVGSLVESLKQHSPGDIDIARKIGDGVRQVLQYVRDVAEGLSEPQVEPDQLSDSLARMVSRLGAHSKTRLSFNADGPVLVNDSIVAMHLYHIAQEACTNALRHANCSQIGVYLGSPDGVVTLRVEDDGVGVPEDVGQGLGMRIMHNRASVIGADLTVGRGEQGGTIVTCTLPDEVRRATQ